MFKYLPLILAGLKRKKLRTILTVLSIMVAFLLYGFLGVFKNGMTGGVQMAGQDRLLLRHRVSFILTLPQSYVNRVKNVEGVEAVCPQTWFGGIYQDKPENAFGTFPVEPEAFLDMFPEFVLKAEEKEAWKRNRIGAIVGRVSAERFGWKVGDRIALKSPIWGQPEGMEQWEFEVCGIYDGANKNTDTSGFYFHYDYFEEGRQREKGRIGWMSIRVDDARRADEIAAHIDAEFANSPYETKTEPEGAFIQGFVSQIGDIAMIVTAIVAAVFFTILLVAGNTMAQSVRERTEEIGVLKALGFTNGQVMRFVLVESCLLALVGGLAGLGLIWLMTRGGSPVPQVMPIFDLPQADLTRGAIFALLLGIVAGAVPAWQAMRLQIATALRKGG